MQFKWRSTMKHGSTVFEQQFAVQFEIVEANSEELINICKKLRYQVFCEERNRFDAKSHNNFSEEDHYDDHAAQTLLKDKISGEYIATARLILSTDREKPFHYPLEECITSHNHVAIDMINNMPKIKTAEISRFAISKQYRKRYKKVTQNPPNEQKLVNTDALITIGLIKSLTKMSADNNVANWLAFMEPSLLRLLSRLGIHFETHGPLINHCGKRYACKKSIGDILNGIKATQPEAWCLITDNGKIAIH